MRWTKLAAACAAVTALTTFAAPPALAQPIFHGAGYKLATSAHDIDFVQTTFTVPAVDCTGVADGSQLTLGAFSYGVSWAAGVRIECAQGAATTLLLAQNGRYPYTSANVLAGDVVRATMVSGGTTTTLRVVDVTTDVDITYYGYHALGVASVGAYAPGAVPAFPTVTMSALVNEQTPFTEVDHVRHTETQDGTKVIGTGFPWHDGTHFNLYYKQAPA